MVVSTAGLYWPTAAGTHAGHGIVTPACSGQGLTAAQISATNSKFLLQGNLILADSNYEVLTLLRSHRDDAKGFAIMARHPYPIHTIRLRQSVTQQQLESALDSAEEKQTLRGTFHFGQLL